MDAVTRRRWENLAAVGVLLAFLAVMLVVLTIRKHPPGGVQSSSPAAPGHVLGCVIGLPDR